MNPYPRFFKPVHFMKANLLKIIPLMAVMTAVCHARTIVWGTPVDSVLVDSHGVTLDDTYVFELGAFTDSFIPSEQPLADWFSHWRVFDSATTGNGYSAADGYVTSTLEMSDSTFDGDQAYLWIHNSHEANNPSTEWLLVKSDDWTFPAYECCDPTPSTEWSVSDLVPADIPQYGYQGGTTDPPLSTNTKGPGIISTSGAYTLQTATFSSYAAVPEPCSSVLMLMLGAMALLDRRRSWGS